MKADHCVLLTASIKCIRFLLQQGIPLREYGESSESNDEGNFVQLLKVLADVNEDVSKAMMRNAHENHQLTSPLIQKDAVSAILNETTDLIIKDLGDELFGILVDESIDDISWEKHMIIFIRYVDARGHIVERLLGVIHVRDTTSLSFKVAIEDLLTRHGLSISRIRSQSYNGASGLRCAFNSLKTLILNENSSAFYIHNFAHQLQLALVAAAKENLDVGLFFLYASQLCNVVCAFYEPMDKLRGKQLEMLIESVSLETIETGTSFYQESTLKRLGDACWVSPYGALVSIVNYSLW
ncbi:uncharacterized protein LOC116012553 [Ipomoea triloba]|uniref:uncharacterized protein LOC116012553 n=1 Tax=Ipomoea triloba TaxID=35885 RepID=UPI00125CE844|nr:uncharacterized protein LOC116012553 [Ipomoea triloba]